MLKNIEAVLFDLDGTLVDSMWMWKDIDIEYLARFGYTYPEGLQEAIEGLSFSETAVYIKERFGIADPIEKMMSDWNDMARYKYYNEVPLKSNVKEFMERARLCGYRMGIGTSNSRELAVGVCEVLGIDNYIDHILTGTDVEHGKPEPDLFLGVASALGTDPSRCMVFEDIVPGIIAAKRAGMTACAVSDKFSEYADDEKRRLADHYIDDFGDIIDML